MSVNHKRPRDPALCTNDILRNLVNVLHQIVGELGAIRIEIRDLNKREPVDKQFLRAKDEMLRSRYADQVETKENN